VVLLPFVAATALIQRREYAAGVLAGIASATKQWPLFFLPAMLSRTAWQRWPRIVPIVVAGPVLAFATYWLVHPNHIVDGIRRVLEYAGTPAGLGTIWIVKPFLLWRPNETVSIVRFVNDAAGLVVFGAALLARKWRQPPAEAVALGMLLLATLSPTSGPRVVLWAIPFLMLAGRMRLAVAVTTVVLPLELFQEFFLFHTAVEPPWYPWLGVPTALLLAALTVYLLLTHTTVRSSTPAAV
jgi:uncharacterized membrane protein